MDERFRELGFAAEDTGGGCRVLRLDRADGRGCLITDGNLEIPAVDRPEDEEIVIGFYGHTDDECEMQVSTHSVEGACVYVRIWLLGF